ncbi:MAG: MBL fold metallo-hydrolase [Nitrososphaerota archaeon]
MKDLPEYIHQVPNTGFSNVYLLEVDPQSLILIDSGTASAGSKILSYLGSIGKDISSIRYVILTHADADHSGSAAHIKRLSGAKIAIHVDDAPRIAGEKKLKEMTGLTGRLLGLFLGFMKIEKIQPDIKLNNGDTIGPLSIIHTPGHTDGSICLYKSNDILFSGDTIIVDNHGFPRLPSSYLNKDTNQLKKSVEKISSLEFSTLLPGHGKPIFSNASALLREYVSNGFRR